MSESGFYFLVQRKKKTHLEYPKPYFIYNVTAQRAREEILERFPGGRIVLQMAIKHGPNWPIQSITLRCGGEKYFITIPEPNYFLASLMTAYREENPDKSCKQFVDELVQARIAYVQDEAHAFSIVERWREPEEVRRD